MVSSDAEARYRLHSDPDYVRYIGDVTTRERSDRQLQSEIVAAGSQGRLILAICDVVTSQMVGECALIDQAHHSLELVVAILPEARGCGRGRAAAGAVITAVLHDPMVSRVIGKVAKGNAASRALVLALGMTPAGSAQDPEDSPMVFEATRASRGA